MANKTKGAFTLAEVLITLVIIGIVAAMTIPTTIAKYKEKEKHAKVKKAYSTIANAMTRMTAAGGDYVFAIQQNDMDSMKDWFNTYLRPYLSISKVCYNNNNSDVGCWSPGRSKYMNGSDSKIGVGHARIDFILNDGTTVDLDDFYEGEIWNTWGVRADAGMSMVIAFDINGGRGPNVVGEDVFAVIFAKNSGIKPAYIDRTQSEREESCSPTGTGASCILKYLQN